MSEPTCNHAPEERDDYGCMACFRDSGAGVLLARIAALLASRDELAALNEKLREALANHGEHARQCVRSRWDSGRPTASGGYEMSYGGVWYEVKPADRSPACECGLDAALALTPAASLAAHDASVAAAGYDLGQREGYKIIAADFDEVKRLGLPNTIESVLRVHRDRAIRSRGAGDDGAKS